MSDEKDNEDKITVLFPGGAPDPEESSAEESSAEESDVEEESAAEQASDETSEEESDDNVVHVAFGPKPTPPEPDSKSPHGVFKRMIEDGMVMVTLDPRVEGTVVPAEFKEHPELRLNFSFHFQLPDFDYDADGVRASLSFKGVRKLCDIPWEAVFMLFCHETGEFAVFEPPLPRS